MRLHSLEITAFGAFAGTEKVDFDALGADGLFLLHGQTGAGKTTVLDAVAFALYGTVPGSRQSGKSLHSDHADRDTCPQVVLEATIGGRDLRITRSPEFMRPKKRGEGFTQQQASGTLEWLDGSGENLSRLNDIGAEVLRLLGMSAEQFFQVVLLPQGEFAKFLKAETKERANLLEKLFDTSRFNSVEDWFRERRRISEAGVGAQRQAIELELAGLAAAAEAENFEPTEDCPSSLVWAEQLVAASVAQASESEAELSSARKTAETAAAELARLQGQARAQQRGSAASAQLAAYRAGEDERRAITVEAELAARAEKVEWAHNVLAASRSERDALLAKAAELEHRLTDDATVGPVLAGGRADGSELDRRTLASAVREWDAELARLEQSRDTEAALAKDRVALASTAGLLGELATKAQASTERLEILPTVVEQVAEKLAGAVAASNSLAGLTAARDEAAAAARAAELLVRALARQSTCERDLERAKTAHNDARDVALDLRERRLNGMAAELAGQLVAGSACAVCGSTEHPEPAVETADVVTKEAEDAAQKVVVDALHLMQEANTQLSAAQQEVAGQTVASGGLAPEAANLALEGAAAALEDAAAIAATVESLRAESADLATQREGLEATLADVRKSIALAEHEAAQLTKRVEKAEATLAEILGADADIAARAARIGAARDQVERFAELLGQAESAEATVVKDQAQVDDAVAAADFDNLQTALSAVRTAGRRADISRELSAAAEQSASARAILQEAEVLAVAGLEAVPVADAELASTTAAAALETALRTHEQANRRRSAVEAKFAALKTAAAKLEPIEKRHEGLAALAEVMLGDGQNSRRMSLGTYVLAARLEEVAVVASRRLRAMSGGRFEFIHSDGKVRRELRGGLALNILDANTGSVRPTSTLSGGETFMASLALALGLADVVAEEAGGIQLETLFIDEGFGTLDAEALDLVMGVLDELRAGGRSVGIVSHVAEMRHRIPSRLFVKKGESGSTLHMSEL